MTKTVYRHVATNEQAIALGFPNVQSYRLAIRQEQARDERLAAADAYARHQTALAKQLQWQGTGHTMRTSPLTPMQAEAARARAAEYGRGDGE